MMTLGLLIMIVGGGAALYGAIGAIGHNYDYGYGYGYEALATGGFGALAIGGLIMLASAVTGIVFMALPPSRKAHGSTTTRRSAPHPKTPTVCRTVPPPPRDSRSRHPRPRLRPDRPHVWQNPQYGQTPQYAPAPQYGQVPPEHENAGPDSGETR